jgi:hypothetical protein
MSSKEEDKLRSDMEKTHCPKCGEPLDIYPCSRGHERLQEKRIEELTAGLKAMFRAQEEIAQEFIAHKRAADWLIINEANLKAKIALTQFGDDKQK